MEVKPGYKQTEVGVIPAEWEVFSLSELTEPQRPISYGIVQTGPNVANGVRCLRVLDIHEGRINKSELITTSKEISDSYRRTVLKAGDLVMPLRGKVGDVGLVDEDMEGANLTRGVALIAIRSGWSPVFCQQVISSTSTRRRLEQAMNGSALQEIPIASLRSFKISTPKNLPEQRAIATALSDVDGLLGGLDRLIAKKRDLKQAAMQQLLTGQTRLPGFHGEWEVKRLDQFAPLQRGFDLPTSQLQRGDYPVVYSNGVQNRHAKFMVKAPGVVTGRSGTIGNVHFVDEDFWPHNTALWVTDFKNNDPKFVFYFLTSVGLERFGTGSGVPTLNRNDVHEFRVSVPATSAEQTAIAEVLTEMDGELAGLEQRREKTRALKQAMMQELLTGRTRLV